MSFQFKQFIVHDEQCGMKVGTDGVLLGAWTPVPSNEQPRILDIGTGSGLIALMLAQRCPTADITALDIDRAAALQARANFDAAPWSERMHAYWADCTQFEDSRGYDLIVSNPPYFVDSLKNPSLQRSVARHTDSLSFDALFAAASRLALREGRLCLVLPAEAVLPNVSDWTLVRKTLVYSKPGELKRVLLEYKRGDAAIASPLLDNLILTGNGPKGRSQEYQILTQDFYLD